MSKPLAYLVIQGVPRVKKNNQSVVLARSRTGKYFPKKVDTPAYKRWHKDAIPQIKKQKPTFEIDFPVNLACRFYMDTEGKVDLSALYEGIQDVLVELDVITDDNYSIVASHDGSGVEVDKVNPRMEITITRKEGIKNVKPKEYRRSIPTDTEAESVF